MKSLILFFLLSFSNLYSFTPGKWSYLDSFTFGTEKFGPVSETVKNRTGQTVYSANYEYNADGKLSKESFLNMKGEPDGEIVYSYENGKLKTEELFAADKTSQEKKTFLYTQAGTLKEINITLGNGKGLLRHRIASMLDGIITECETKWEEEGNIESFSVKKDILDETVLVQEVFDEKKKSIGFIRHYHDKKGRLEKRENVQGSSKRMQVLTYDETGKLISFSFHVKQDENWVLVKTHYFTYTNSQK
jgi:antitoxin component YwqK of YwqJK toxin-antitoxin module